MSNIVTMDALGQNPIGIVPIKAIPKNQLEPFLETQFKFWLANLINIKSDNEGALDEALKGIMEQCWGMNLTEIKKMMELYVDGKLSIVPRSNYFDRILLGNIISAYKKDFVKKKYEEPKPIELSEEEKANNSYLNIIFSFDDYIQDGTIDKCYTVVYDELTSRGILKYSEKERLEVFKITKERFPHKTKETCIEVSKIALLRRFYDVLISKNQHIKQLL